MTPPSPTQSRIIWFAVTFLAIGMILALLASIIWGLGKVLHVFSPILWPLAIAAVLSYLLDPLVDFLQRRKVPRNRAIIVVFAAAVFLMLGIAGAIVPRLVVETRELAHRIPGYAAEIQDRVELWMEKAQARVEAFNAARTPSGTNAPTEVTPPASPTPAEQSWDKQVAQSAVSWLKAAGPAIGGWLVAQVSRVAAWAGLLGGIALVPVYCFYFLKEKMGIQRNWTNYLPIHESRLKEEIVFVLTSINDYLIVFFRGQVLVAACDAVLYTIGFFAVDLNFALLMGLMAGALSIIPFLGAVLTIVPAVTLAAVQHRDWLHPLLVVGVFAAVQLLEGFVISPKIIGDRVGLHPLTIIIAVIVGTTLLGGILGGILAIPLTAALRVLMFRYVWKVPDVVVTAPARGSPSG
jgi:predicted PurR-regulated permease PerM